VYDRAESAAPAAEQGFPAGSAKARLVEALSSDDAAVRDRAARALGSSRDELALEPLLAAAERHPGEQALVWALAQFHDARLVAPLVAGLEATGETTRWLAASKLGDLGDRTAVAPLLRALERDGAPPVREQAARSLGLLGDPAALEPLIAALGDRGAHVREEAAGALGQLGDPRAHEHLKGALRDKHVAVRRAAAAALNRLDQPGP
jgi:HEAT repeat protein